MTLRKRKKGINNPFDKSECEYIVLVGTEGGTTRKFAILFHNELLRLGKRSYLTDMNAYTRFAKAEQLIVFTCTYGDGEAPINATHFAHLWAKYPPAQPLAYSVLGFGSDTYPDFCKYAKEVDQLLLATAQAECAAQKLTLALPDDFSVQPQRKPLTFTVTEKTPVMDDDIFLIALRPSKKSSFVSGDLLGITPEDGRERLYSVAKYQGDVWLSVKLHSQGVVSNLLNNLQIGDTLQAALVANKHFHFPKKAPQVVCIANGSGMAPFIGMIAENTQKKPITLIWGCRREASLGIYRPYIEQFTREGKIANYWQALSREGDKFYVQDILQREAPFFAELLKNKGIIMICGSVAMEKAVTEVLEAICREHLEKPLSYFQNKGQIKTDCY